METLVVLNALFENAYPFEKAFDGKSAIDLSFAFAKKLADNVVVFCDESEIGKRIQENFAGEKILFVSKSNWNIAELFSSLANACEKFSSESAFYAFADCPFLNVSLAEKIIEVHQNYKAEYTFADGYPFGLALEALHKDSANILHALVLQDGSGTKKITRDSIMESVKRDINNFEIETVLSKNDYRSYRFSFETNCKRNFIACKNLFEAKPNFSDADELSEKACALSSVVKTLPAFYQVQIVSDEDDTCIYSPYKNAFQKKFGKLPSSETKMSIENFSRLVKSIADFSDDAVVSLSFFSEAFLHPQLVEFISLVTKEKNLSLVIETNALHITNEVLEKIKNVANEKILWFVNLDAMTEETYKIVHQNSGSLTKAIAGLSLLEKFFPDSVYAQFIRMNENESELENFYRYWSDEKNPSHGKIAIQKYDSFCKFLDEKKVADLSPIERNPCWHLRRDFCIFVDGSVPLCRSSLFQNIIGNVFKESIEVIWKKMNSFLENDMKKNYTDFCKNCDEYYTFNF